MTIFPIQFIFSVLVAAYYGDLLTASMTNATNLVNSIGAINNCSSQVV